MIRSYRSGPQFGQTGDGCPKYAALQVYGANEAMINSLVDQEHYVFTVDSINENGITLGTVTVTA
jgi:hypothetical protein